LILEEKNFLIVKVGKQNTLQKRARLKTTYENTKRKTGKETKLDGLF